MQNTTWVYDDFTFNVFKTDSLVGLDNQEFSNYLDLKYPLINDDGICLASDLARNNRDYGVQLVYKYFEAEIPELLGVKLNVCITDCGEPTYRYTNINCTLLELLKQDAKVTFNNGTWLKGDSETKYIEVGTEVNDQSQGVWFLTEEGLFEAVKDLEKMYKELHSEEG